jgi:hypothetical protein
MWRNLRLELNAPNRAPTSALLLAHRSTLRASLCDRISRKPYPLDGLTRAEETDETLSPALEARKEKKKRGERETAVIPSASNSRMAWMASRFNPRSVTKRGSCRMDRRVLEMYNEGLDRSNARRALGGGLRRGN